MNNRLGSRTPRSSRTRTPRLALPPPRCYRVRVYNAGTARGGVGSRVGNIRSTPEGTGVGNTYPLRMDVPFLYPKHVHGGGRQGTAIAQVVMVQQILLSIFQPT